MQQRGHIVINRLDRLACSLPQSSCSLASSFSATPAFMACEDEEHRNFDLATHSNSYNASKVHIRWIHAQEYIDVEVTK